MEQIRTILSAENLTFKYGKRTVLEGVSFAIDSGEIFGLLGPNGAGKTTCIQLLAGLLPDKGRGRVLLSGEDVSEKSIQKRSLKGMIYLPQESSIFRKLNVRQNLELVLQERKVEKRKIKQLVDKSLETFDLEELEHALSATLSGGERRRLEIARAIVLDPKVILLDEPFAGIDPIGVVNLQKILDKLRSFGIAVLISDHNVRETLKICDRAMIINEGRTLCDGTPEEISLNKIAKNKYLGDDFKLDS